MKYRVLTALSLLIMIFSAVAVRAAENNPTYFVTIPEFPININYLTFTEKNHLGYPMFFYKYITYFPLNYHNMEIVGLNMQIEGNKIFLNFEENISPKPLVSDSWAKLDKYGKYYAVSGSPFELYINGEKYEDENYPILFCGGIVYLPLTWDVAVNKLGWDFCFDGEKIEMYTPSFYYTAGGDSYIKVMEDGSREFVTVENSSYYRYNGVTVFVATKILRLIGPNMQNMYIEVNGEKKDVPGYTGYYQKNGPMFTVEDGYVYTVHFDDQIKRDNRRCRINIYTLEIEYLE